MVLNLVEDCVWLIAKGYAPPQNYLPLAFAIWLAHFFSEKIQLIIIYQTLKVNYIHIPYYVFKQVQ